MFCPKLCNSIVLALLFGSSTFRCWTGVNETSFLLIFPLHSWPRGNTTENSILSTHWFIKPVNIYGMLSPGDSAVGLGLRLDAQKQKHQSYFSWCGKWCFMLFFYASFKKQLHFKLRVVWLHIQYTTCVYLGNYNANWKWKV